MSEERKVVAVSGGFDPVHVGHIQMIEEAAEHGDVMVIINSDDWLLRKKGYIFMPFQERKKIIQSIKYVKKVIDCIDENMSVCKTLEKLKPDIFCNGGDRKNINDILEADICKRLNIKMIFDIGGTKIQSSSSLVKKISGNIL